MQDMGGYSLSNQEFDLISDTIKREEQEVFREKALELVNVKLQEGEIAREILQKAFLTF